MCAYNDETYAYKSALQESVLNAFVTNAQIEKD